MISIVTYIQILQFDSVIPLLPQAKPDPENNNVFIIDDYLRLHLKQ